MFVWVCAHACQCLQKSEVTDTPGTGFGDICEPSNMGVGIKRGPSARTVCVLVAEPPF